MYYFFVPDGSIHCSGGVCMEGSFGTSYWPGTLLASFETCWLDDLCCNIFINWLITCEPYWTWMGFLLANTFKFILVSSQCVYGMTSGNKRSLEVISKILMQVVDDGCSIWICILRMEAWPFHLLCAKHRKIKTVMHLLQTTIASSYSVSMPIMILLDMLFNLRCAFWRALKQKWAGWSTY